MALRIGTLAPELSYTTKDGTQRSLRDLRGQKHAIVYFYPADFTAVCTRETCGFRDASSELAAADTEIIGVSSDSGARHEEFAAAYEVPFALVADPDLTIARAWGAAPLLMRALGKTTRVTYVIDKQGLIRGVFEGMLSASHHVDGARALIRRGL